MINPDLRDAEQVRELWPMISFFEESTVNVRSYLLTGLKSGAISRSPI